MTCVCNQRSADRLQAADEQSELEAKKRLQATSFSIWSILVDFAREKENLKDAHLEEQEKVRRETSAAMEAKHRGTRFIQYPSGP